MADHILLIKHGAFGDLIQADGVFKDIRRHFVQAKITLVTQSLYSQLMLRSPYIDAVIVDDRAPLWHLPRQYQLKRRLQACQADRVIDLQNSSRTHWYQRLLLPAVPWLRRQGPRRHISGLRGLEALLTTAGIKTRYALQPDVSWMATDIDVLLQKNKIAKPYIALIPGSSAKHPQKRWPYYAELASALLAKGHEVVKILGPDEQALAQKIPGKQVQTADKAVLNWFQLAGVLQQAQYIIGNDTGPSHVAANIGTPGLVLFGQKGIAKQTEIEKKHFKVIEVDDFNQLSCDEVLASVLAALT